jgi:hypothetical protein
MSCDTIKFKVSQDHTTKDIELQIYRPFNESNGVTEWMMVDRFNEMSIQELKCMADFIYSLFKKKA